MLTQVLEAMQQGDGAVDLRALSRELHVEPSALEGMIQFWVRKGRLVDASAAGGAECMPCGPTCGGDVPCPFVVAAPRVVTVAGVSDPVD